MDKIIGVSSLGKGLKVEDSKVIVDQTAIGGISDITVDGSTITIITTDGQRHPIRLPPDVFINSLTLNKTVLTAGRANSSPLRVDLATILPPIVADKFLKDVKYDAKSKKLVFVVGDNSGKEDKEISIDVADFATTKVGKTLVGDGTEATPLEVKVSTSNGNLLKAGDDGLVVKANDVVSELAITELNFLNGDVIKVYTPKA